MSFWKRFVEAYDRFEVALAEWEYKVDDALTIKTSVDRERERREHANIWKSVLSATKSQKEKALGMAMARGEEFFKNCETIETDLIYVYGSKWREILAEERRERGRLPYDIKSSSLQTSRSSEFWIYHLFLAHMGKVDYRMFVNQCGYVLGTETESRDISFLRRMERALLKSGAYTARFVLEMDRSYRGSFVAHNSEDFLKIRAATDWVVFDFDTTAYTLRLWEDYDEATDAEKEAELMREYKDDELNDEIYNEFQSFLCEKAFMEELDTHITDLCNSMTIT